MLISGDLQARKNYNAMNKKVLMAALLSVVCAASAMAQKTNQVISLKETQARLLDVMSNAYVRPLTVELEVDDSKGRIRDKWELTGAELTDLGVISANGTIELSNLRSYGVYKSAQKHNCDVIVAATFNFETGEMDTLQVKGRHDACFALRTPVVVEAMTAIVLADLVTISA